MEDSLYGKFTQIQPGHPNRNLYHTVVLCSSNIESKNSEFLYVSKSLQPAWASSIPKCLSDNSVNIQLHIYTNKAESTQVIGTTLCLLRDSEYTFCVCRLVEYREAWTKQMVSCSTNTIIPGFEVASVYLRSCSHSAAVLRPRMNGGISTFALWN